MTHAVLHKIKRSPLWRSLIRSGTDRARIGWGDDAIVEVISHLITNCRWMVGYK